MKNKIDVDGIIFDMGSTLIEYENIPWRILNLDCLKSGYEFLVEESMAPPPLEEFSDTYLKIREEYRDEAAETLIEYNILTPLVRLLEETNLPDPEELADRFFEAYYRPVVAQLTIFADTVSVLDRLKKAGKKIGLVSNTIFPENYHVKELAQYRLHSLFDFTIFSSTFGWRKPHPKIYDEAIRLIGLPPERLLFVGDRYLEDYLGPRESGMRAIIRFREGREYPNPMPRDVIIIKALSGLLPMLGITNGNI